MSNSPSPFRSAVAFSHFVLREKVRPGDTVVDATCGNGNDTLFLARLVGEAGRVWAFDVQEKAIAGTRAVLAEAGVLSRVELVLGGHEGLAKSVSVPVRACVFNLGYLPGSDKTVITRSVTTIAALDQAADLLLPDGILVVVGYPGHPGGEDECRAVNGWAGSLPPREWRVWNCRQVNLTAASPFVTIVEKSGPSP